MFLVNQIDKLKAIKKWKVKFSDSLKPFSAKSCWMIRYNFFENLCWKIPASKTALKTLWLKKCCLFRTSKLQPYGMFHTCWFHYGFIRSAVGLVGWDVSVGGVCFDFVDDPVPVFGWDIRHQSIAEANQKRFQRVLYNPLNVSCFDLFFGPEFEVASDSLTQFLRASQPIVVGQSPQVEVSGRTAHFWVIAHAISRTIVVNVMVL